MRLLDLFCGAGGAAMGYHRAGFDEIVGIDIKTQPRYPFQFVQSDALEFCASFGAGFDAIHASPPCQAYSTVSGRSKKANKVYVDLVDCTRALLVRSNRPFIIENVPQAPLLNPIQLCGSAFGLDVRRHRDFESNHLLLSNGCNHEKQPPRFRSLNSRIVARGALCSVIGVHGHLNYPGEFALRCAAMGIDWMKNDELSQAIPPAYTEYIGKQLLQLMGAA